MRNRTPFILAAAIAAVCHAPQKAEALISVFDGSAEVSWNAGYSQSMGVPALLTPSSANYDFRDLTTHLTGTLAKDWASVSWNLQFGALTDLFISGHTIERYTTFRGPDGFLYGQGVATFEAILSLDMAYRFTVEATGFGGLGVSMAGLPNTGILHAGFHPISFTSIGGSRGFAPNLTQSENSFGVTLHLIPAPDIPDPVPDPVTPVPEMSTYGVFAAVPVFAFAIFRKKRV